MGVIRLAARLSSILSTISSLSIGNSSSSALAYGESSASPFPVANVLPDSPRSVVLTQEAMPALTITPAMAAPTEKRDLAVAPAAAVAASITEAPTPPALEARQVGALTTITVYLPYSGSTVSTLSVTTVGAVSVIVFTPTTTFYSTTTITYSGSVSSTSTMLQSGSYIGTIDVFVPTMYTTTTTTAGYPGYSTSTTTRPTSGTVITVIVETYGIPVFCRATVVQSCRVSPSRAHFVFDSRHFFERTIED